MYKTINGFTKQQMLDTIANDFKGKAVLEGTNQCKYLTADGKKCAVGLFIPDGHPAQSSAYGIYELSSDVHRNHPSAPELKLPLDMPGLESFQMSHDSLNKLDSQERQKQILLDWVNINVED